LLFHIEYFAVDIHGFAELSQGAGDDKIGAFCLAVIQGRIFVNLPLALQKVVGGNNLNGFFFLQFCLQVFVKRFPDDRFILIAEYFKGHHNNLFEIFRISRRNKKKDKQ